MLTGPIRIIECPQCAEQYQQLTLMSGNTFGARFWSDGYMEAEMLPQYPEATKCGKCKKFFWVDDAPFVCEIMEYEREKLAIYRNAKDVAELSSTDILRFLNEAKHKPDREKYLRFCLWQKLNHKLRMDPSAELSERRRKQFVDNLESLLVLLKRKNADDVIARCEVLREVGRFQEASGLAVRHGEKHGSFMKQIGQKSDRQESRVFEFKEDTRELILECPVAGTVFHDYATTESLLTLTCSSALILRREPGNQFDRNAVEVCTADGKKLGYIPQSANEGPAKMLDEGIALIPEIVRVDPDADEWERITIVVLKP